MLQCQVPYLQYGTPPLMVKIDYCVLQDLVCNYQVQTKVIIIIDVEYQFDF